MTQTQTEATAGTTKAPFGAIYFGALLALVGAFLVFSGVPEAGIVALSGVLFVCTGMIQRTIHRLYEG